MSPELSRRVAAALGTHQVTLDERSKIVDSLVTAEDWSDLPKKIRALVETIEARSGWVEDARVVALVAAGPDSVSPDDLAGITPLWSQAVQDDLLPVVAEVYQDAAGTVHAQLIDATDLPTIPPVTSLASEAYLAQASNTFDEVGADLWETARGELLDGFQQGESIPELRDRLRASAGLTGRNATLVARTQVLDASNAGSYDTARVSGLDLLKGWEATPDARTRDTHSAAGAFYQGDGMIALNGKFVVGGFQCDRPHDPSLPPAERYNCRCTLIYAMAPAVPAPPKDRSAEIEAWHAQRLAQVKALHDQRLGEAVARHARKLADLDASDAAETVVDAAQTRHAARLAKLNAAFEARRVALAEERARRLGEQVVRPEPSPSPPVPSVTVVTREEAERLVADLPEGPDIYYHGTRSTVDDLDRKLASLSPDDPDGEIYLTDNPEFSLPYLEGDPGTVHAIRLSESARIASEDELWEAAEDALPGGVEGFFGYRPYAFDLAEHPQVRAELGRRGFDGAAFRDIAPNNVVEHDSVVVWSRAAVVGRVDRREVPQIGPDKALSPAAPKPPPAIPAAGTVPPPVLVRPRPSLAAATSTDEINTAFLAEWQRAVQGLPQRRRPTIRPPMVRFGGDLDTAREHAEGLLRSVEQFPAVRLRIGRDPVGAEYASTEGTFITFVDTWAANRPAYLANLAQSAARRWHPPSISSPGGVAAHEFAHALIYTVAPKLTSPAKFRALVARIEATVRAYAAERGLPMDEVIKAEVSEWAALGTGRAGSAMEELAAEAFAQVLLEGDAAPVLARRVFALLVDEYDRATGLRVAPTLVGDVDPLARGVAEALQALTQGRTLAEVRTLLEALPEAKDALTVARRATTTQGLTRSLTALATRRGLTLPSARELKAIQAAERAALVAERKAARAAAAEAARAARAEKAKAAEAKREAARLAKEEKARQAEAARLAKEAGASKAELRLIRLSEQTPTGTRQLGGGAMADVRLLSYPDGSEIVEKIYGPRSRATVAEVRSLVDSEVLGAKVFETLGVRAPAVVQAGARGRLVMEYMDGEVGGGPYVSLRAHAALEAFMGQSDEGRLFGLADFLIGNTDRNSGNWLLTHDRHFIGIDFGSAFQDRGVLGVQSRSAFTRYLLIPDAYRLAKTVDIAPEDLAIIRRRLEALEPRFAEAKRLTWFRQMMRRLDALEKRASGTRRIITS